MDRPIPPLDFMWLLLEKAQCPMHVGALFLFEKRGQGRDVVREIVGAYRACEPIVPTTSHPPWRTSSYRMCRGDAWIAETTEAPPGSEE